jgi:hypothetical protein
MSWAQIVQAPHEIHRMAANPEVEEPGIIVEPAQSLGAVCPAATTVGGCKLK